MNDMIPAYALEPADVVFINGERCVIREVEDPEVVNRWEGENLVQLEMINVLYERESGTNVWDLFESAHMFSTK